MRRIVAVLAGEGLTVAASIIRSAHGMAREGGAELVAEAPPLDEIGPPNAHRTAEGLALRVARGRPFQIGNAAAAGRGPSLTRVTTCDGADVVPDSPEERRRARRKAASLAGRRRRELDVMAGGTVSSAVMVEIVAWASATAWADVYERAGDAVKATAFREKASAFGLKALGLAEREAAVRPPRVEEDDDRWDPRVREEAMRAKERGEAEASPVEDRDGA